MHAYGCVIHSIDAAHLGIIRGSFKNSWQAAGAKAFSIMDSGYIVDVGRRQSFEYEEFHWNS